MIKEIRLRMVEKDLNQKKLAEKMGVNESRLSTILAAIKKGNIKVVFLLDVLDALDLELEIKKKGD